MITENLSTFKIHKLTKTQYDRELEAGNLDERALYLTPDKVPTAEEVGAAPSGYGLGTGGVYPSSVGLTNANIARSGFYRWDTEGQSDGFPFVYGTMIVGARGKDSASFQLAMCHAETYKGTMAARLYSANTEYAWEYLNPPMIVGVEYRTTLRHNGKVVYCKAISCGALPSAGNRKVVATGTVAMTGVVGHYGYAVESNGNPISFPIYASTGVIGYHVVGGEAAIYIECEGDGSSFTSSYIAVWYTKD